MTKNEYIGILKKQLRGIPENELNEILYDYKEHFNIGLDEGRSESEIASSLGNPKSLAKEIRATYMINKVEDSFTVRNFFNALFATFALGFFNIIFILGPFIGVAATLFGIFVSGIAIIGSGLLVIVAGFIPAIPTNISHPIIGVFIGFALMSFGGLWVMGSVYLNKWFYQLAIKYLRFNLNIITNRRDKVV